MILKRNNFKKLFIRLIFGVIVFVIVYSMTFLRYKFAIKKINSVQKCFQLNAKIQNVLLLEDVLEAEFKPKLDKSIFFHETSCSNDGRITLTSRQACSIESAAKWNPNREVFVLFSAPVGHIPNETSSSALKALQSYPNIHFRNVNFVNYSIGTPAAEWIKGKTIYYSRYLNQHMADFLRLASLYKFGGIYLDFNVIVVKNIDNLPPNFVATNSDGWISNDVMGFESDCVGHKIVKMVLRESVTKYHPAKYSWNGAGALTRIMKKLCGRMSTHEMTPELCWGVTIVPSQQFFPIQTKRSSAIFFDINPKIVEEALTLSGNSITIDLWDKFSIEQTIHKSKRKTALEILAEENCPLTFDALIKQ